MLRYKYYLVCYKIYVRCIFVLGILLENVCKYCMVSMVFDSYHNCLQATVLSEYFPSFCLVIWYAADCNSSALFSYYFPPTVGVLEFTVTLRCALFVVLFYCVIILLMLLYARLCTG